MTVRKVDVDVMGMTLIAMSGVPNYFSAPLPSYLTIRRFAGRDAQTREETKTDIRRGEIRGTIPALMEGIGAAIIVRHPLPLIACAAMVAYYIATTYEHALANPHPTAEAIDGQGY